MLTKGMLMTLSMTLHKRYGARCRWQPLALIVAVTCLLCHPAGASGLLDRSITFDIPAEPLDESLIEFSKQAGVPVSVAAQSVHRIRAPALKGTLVASVALAEILA